MASTAEEKGGSSLSSSSYVACSPRNSMTRRSHSLKKSQDGEFLMDSPKQGHSAFAENECGDCSCEAFSALHFITHFSHKKSSMRHQLFCFFFVFLVFFAVVKVLAIGWIGSQIEQQTGIKVSCLNLPSCRS
jgi:hypothetical protein